MAAGLAVFAADNPWQGKNVAFLGDGLTAAADSPRYWSVLQTNLGLTPWVYATAGATMAQIKSQAEALKAEHATGVDGIVILAGLEDYAADCPLGSWYQVSGTPPQRQFALDADTFRGRINRALDYLKDNFPEAEIILLTPIHRGYASTTTDGELPDESFGNPSDLHLDDYVNVLKEASGVWSVPLVDLYGECGLFASPDDEQSRIAATLTYALVRRPGVVLAATASPMDIDDAGDASVWINGDTSSPQDWQTAENWQDGKVPAAGADVVVKASANINFAGADIGSITHEDGVLQIDSSGAQMTLRGDFTSTGANVTLNNTPIALTSGEHVFTVSGAFQHDIASVFSGTDVVFVKKGVGTFGVTLGGAAVYTYTGEFRLLEGTLITGSTNSSCWQNYLFSGISKFTLAGTLSMYNYYKLNSSVELVVLEGGKITWTGNYGSYGFTMTVKKASYLGMPCAAGNWGSSAAGSAARIAPFISTGNDKARLIVSECESDASCYTGRGGYDSDIACHWTGAASTDWTDEANWKDGKVPQDGWDVFIDATASRTPDPATVPALVIRDLVDKKSGSHAICGDKGLIVSGSIYLASGSKSCGSALTLTDGMHFFDGEGLLKLIEHEIEGGGELVNLGSGQIVENAEDTSGGKTRVWINDDTSAAQDWKVPANWQDGKVPNPGDNVIIGVSAKINFGGAELASIIQTNGTLTVDSGKVSMILGKDIVATGSGVTINNTPIKLTAGDHVISNTCAFAHDAATTWSSDEDFVRLLKYGKGSFTCGGGSKIYTFAGSIELYGGTVKLDGDYNNVAVSGPTNILVSGRNTVLNLYNFDNLNHNATLRFENGAQIQWSGNYTSVQFDCTVKRMFIDGQQCVAGNWGPFNSSYPHKMIQIYSTVNANVRIAVTEGPAEGGFEGLSVMWSGNVKHWTGAVNNSWSTAGNWEEGEVPRLLDDIVIGVDVTRMPNSDWGTLAHHSVYIDTTNDVTVGKPKAIYGDLHVAKGKKTHGWATYNFPKGEHVIDIDEGGNLYLYNATTFAGAGNLIKTGRGTIQAGMGGANSSWTSTGSLTVKDGTVDLISGAKIEGITNVALEGAGKLILRGANLSADATVRVDASTKLQLTGTFSNDIKHLILDGKDRLPRTYGGLKSEAERRLARYFTSGTGDKGVLNVTEGYVNGFIIQVK